MGFDSQNVIRGALVLDVEAVAIADAADYIEEPTPPSNYVKAEAIAKYVEKAKAEQLDKCALDIDLARIVAIGTWHSDDKGPCTLLCPTEDDERHALAWFWSVIKPYPYPRLIGWNVCGYDLPLLLRRSLYLGVDAPPIQLGKYRHPDVDDLMLTWSLDGAVKFRSLAFVCRRLGINIPDTLTGADIAQAVAESRWVDVEAHLTADVRKTALLAERLGCFRLRQAVTA